ncbi:MAG: nuclear transport factor 2 family protein [Caulobacter sp.]|nr:nuclear transport factor 2 family protein [Caulobacter sp.]
MRLPSAGLAALALGLALAGGALASDAADAQAVVDTEAAFARRAAEIGNVPAFREFAAPGVIMFLPEPIVATDYLARADWPGRIEWRPDFVAVSGAADLAFASGPSRWTVKGEVDPGYYITVWARQPDGAWKFVLDRSTPGTPDLYAADEGPAAVHTGVAAGGSKSTPAGLEAVLADALSRDAPGAIGRRMDPAGRVIRAGAAPATTPDAVRALLARDPAEVTASYLGGAMSSSSDLAYVWGETRWREEGQPRRGHFVRLWRRSGQAWTILVDHQVALPAAPSPAPLPVKD